ncbi:hypothetical protein [Streptomyces sp. CBMA156]|uniref:hypothetical protein n=1 Tax=Streptomyces sp. CBMA156 TaxID=1930280 RepID=UPI001661C0F1|nr:hypothetical protein [Streptomyces sp. CBMA156]
MFRTRTRHRATVRAIRVGRVGRVGRAVRASVAGGLVLAALTGVAPASATGTESASATATASATESGRRDGRPARPAGVSGSARISYAFSPDDEIRFTVDAQAAPYTRPYPGTNAAGGLPTDARGTVRYSHRVAATGQVYQAVAEVDCLSTGGPVATLTAVVSTSDTGNAGERIGLSIHQGSGGEGGRLGFSWGVANLDVGADGKPYQPVVGTCMAPAPFAPVIRGGFTVHHTELEPPLPAGR